MARYADADSVPKVERDKEEEVKEKIVEVPVVVSVSEMFNIINKKLDILLSK